MTTTSRIATLDASLVALAVDPLEDRALLPGTWLVAVLIALSLLTLRGHAGTYLLVGPAVAVATTVLARAAQAHPDLPAWADPVRRLGVISYGAYLWNYPLTLWLRPLGAAGMALAVVLTVLLAAASRHGVELPAERWARRRWPAQRPAVRAEHETVPS